MDKAPVVSSTNSGSTNQELMRRVQADDTEAFGVLYDRLSSRALRVAEALCQDGERARDAVQDGFLSLWHARANYQPERGEVHAWVFSIVRNRALDSRRLNERHDRHRTRGEESAEDLRAPGDIQDDVVSSDAARALRARLGKLPDAQREVIALAYFGQLTHSEIAERLALPLGTVKGRMRLGLDKLHERLNP